MDTIKFILENEMNGKVCSTTRVCVVDGRKFLDIMRHEHVCFSIVPKDGKVEEEVPTKVVDLLEEFPNIFFDNVPNGLHQCGRSITRLV